jgi:DNA-directed RNA polymerase subunit beta'
MGKLRREFEFDYLKVKLASRLQVIEWSNRKLPNGQFLGEITKSETINYKTFKPEMDGLFCERLFGPSNSLECLCGKYKRVRYEGLICERCGVELTESRVRRHRMGYVDLIYPVTHVWYINSRPNFLALLLEIEGCEKRLYTSYSGRSKECEDCGGLKLTTSTFTDLYDERIQRIKLASLAYFVGDDEVSLYGLHWDLEQYRRNREQGNSGYSLKPFPKPTNPRSDSDIKRYFRRVIPIEILGTPLIQRELESLDVESELLKTRCFVFICTQVLNKTEPFYSEFYWSRKWENRRMYKIQGQAVKRIRILENLISTKSKPGWMILSILPIIPPALRPMIQLEGGRFATSDLNELYRRIINRNNRLRRLSEITIPHVILRNEKRLLQEAVDNLIDNSKRGQIAFNAKNRPLKSLSDIIKGKEGRFRQNLLGKRVDYSGRSVIVVGPSLKLNQCGLPHEMALELFQPFVIRELISQGLASNMKLARNLIQKKDALLQPVLEKILSTHPVFLNRAPTLHRLGVQAFEPVLVNGRAIKLHPLVCTAFNADFDGDQMAVHIPLSPEAQAECYMLLLAPYNFVSPANGEPIIVPSQDMVLGCYYLTASNMKNLLGSNHYFMNLEDVTLAYNQKKIEIHSVIWVKTLEYSFEAENCLKKIQLKDGTSIEYYKELQIRRDKNNTILVQYLKTTTGRVILNQTIKKTLNSFQ